MTPTPEQKNIIEEGDNAVVIAKPGSGKTFVLSQKIKTVLPVLPEYRGVIAISYTNKASDELKKRCLNTGIDKKASFFGTIDKFFLSEIIIPFGKQLFGIPKNEIINIKREDLSGEEKEDIEKLPSISSYDQLGTAHIEFLSKLFLQGKLILDFNGLLALYVFDKSPACRNYLQARYSYLMVDEYQDSGKEQHELFLKLYDLGLKCTAVGDANQSIFAFSGKSPEFLIALADKFPHVFPLTWNHRCHASIVKYSNRFLSAGAHLLPTDTINVHEKFIDGDEASIAQWLNVAIPEYCNFYNVTDYNEVGILVKNSRTGDIIHQNLAVNHKYFASTDLESDFTLWSGLFNRILYFIYNEEDTKLQVVEEYLDPSFAPKIVKEVIAQLQLLIELFENIDVNIDRIIGIFEGIAKVIFPHAVNSDSMRLLEEVLRSPETLTAYKPASKDEVQLMTIHKSKGLEFDLVFHLDLYEWILPSKGIEDNKQKFFSLQQDANLHYVGITRARKACILCCSSLRHNTAGSLKQGSWSEFLGVRNLGELRINSPF